MKQKAVLQLVICLASLALFSCRSTKITRATFPSDTTGARPGGSPGGTDLALARSILQKVNANRLEYKTFSAEMKMDYEDDKGKKMNNLGVNVRMQYDSVIWIRVSGPLNVEGARILVTKDSIKIINKMENTVTLRSVSEGKELLKMDLSLSALQDLIVGNPVFLSDSISQIVTTPSIISFASLQPGLESMFNVFADDFLVQQCKITEKDSTKESPRVVELTYGDHKPVAGKKMAFQRKIYVEEKNVVKVALDFRKMELDKTLTFPFTIPPSYTRQ